MGGIESACTPGHVGQTGVSQASAIEVVMEHPKINSAKAIDGHTLLIEFENSSKKLYDIHPLLEKQMFYPLTNFAFFKNVQVDTGGYAVFWNEDIDLSECELWTKGQTVDNR